ncbi:MAG: hypothetical protein P1U63_05490 [Coxiellaceae bacterium]|nr:hypothetical protein [Coxiellaceae bacterium]
MYDNNNSCSKVLRDTLKITGLFAAFELYGSILGAGVIGGQLPGGASRNLSERVLNTFVSSLVFGFALPVLGVAINEFDNRVRLPGWGHRSINNFMQAATFLLPLISIVSSEITGAAIMASANGMPQDSEKTAGIEFGKALFGVTALLVVTFGLLRVRACREERHADRNYRIAARQRKAKKDMVDVYAYTQGEAKLASSDYNFNNLLLANHISAKKGGPSLPYKLQLEVLSYLKPTDCELPVPASAAHLSADVQLFRQLELFRRKQLKRLHTIHRNHVVADMQKQGAPEGMSKMLTSGSAVNVLLLCNIASKDMRVALSKGAQLHILQYLLPQHVSAALTDKMVRQAAIFQIKRHITRVSRGEVVFDALAPLSNRTDIQRWAEEFAQHSSCCLLLMAGARRSGRSAAISVALLRTAGRPALPRDEVVIDVGAAARSGHQLTNGDDCVITVAAPPGAGIPGYGAADGGSGEGEYNEPASPTGDPRARLLRR